MAVRLVLQTDGDPGSDSPYGNPDWKDVDQVTGDPALVIASWTKATAEARRLIEFPEEIGK